jgi:hypothetical protein
MGRLFNLEIRSHCLNRCCATGKFMPDPDPDPPAFQVIPDPAKLMGTFLRIYLTSLNY